MKRSLIQFSGPEEMHSLALQNFPHAGGLNAFWLQLDTFGEETRVYQIAPVTARVRNMRNAALDKTLRTI